MSPEEFNRLAAAGHTRIPVVREVLSDLDTPLSVYLKLADGPNTYLFESVEGGETWGRYSIIGLPARRSYEFRGHALQVREYGEVVDARAVADPLAEIDALRAAVDVPVLPGLPVFTGGLVGYFGFGTIGWIEPRLVAGDAPDPLGVPDALLLLSEEVAVFDNLAGRLYLVVHADPSQPQAHARAQRRLDELVHRLRHSGRSYPDVLDPSLLQEDDFVSGFTREGFLAAVAKAKDYIRAGDVFQVVLSQRMSVPFRARPVDVYRALRALNPSPYMYFLDLDGFQVVGSSPEILVRMQGGEVTVRPIAGTRPRGILGRRRRAGHRAHPGPLPDRTLLARDAHRQRGAWHAAARHRFRRRAARDVPGRHRQRRAEDPRAGGDPRQRARLPGDHRVDRGRGGRVR